MPLPKQVAQQAAEAERLAQQFSGEPPTPEATPTPAPAPQPSPVPAPQPAPVPTPAPAPSNEAAEWKHKYDVLQGKYNAEVPNLQSQLQNAMGALGNMGRELDTLKEQVANARAQPQPIEARVTAADEATWGADMTDFIRRAAQEEAQRMMQPLVQENAQLKTQVERLGGRTDQMIQSAQQSKEDIFWSRLLELVPTWQTMNVDRAFIDWLAQREPMTGLTRQDMLTDACNKLDAQRAAAFFTTFAATMTPPPARQELESQISPRGQRGGGQPAPAGGGQETVEIWSQEEIQQFYTDVTKGHYRHNPQEQQRMNDAITKAVAEGRVR